MTTRAPRPRPLGETCAHDAMAVRAELHTRPHPDVARTAPRCGHVARVAIRYGRLTGVLQRLRQSSVRIRAALTNRPDTSALRRSASRSGATIPYATQSRRDVTGVCSPCVHPVNDARHPRIRCMTRAILRSSECGVYRMPIHRCPPERTGSTRHEPRHHIRPGPPDGAVASRRAANQPAVRVSQRLATLDALLANRCLWNVEDVDQCLRRAGQPLSGLP